MGEGVALLMPAIQRLAATAYIACSLYESWKVGK